MKNEEYMIEAKEFIEVPEGKHNGIIKEVRISTTTEGRDYDYVDFIVTIDDFEDVETLRFGVPANISEISKLGKLLTESGFEWSSNMEYGMTVIKKHFEGKKITYKTINTKGKKQPELEFANILVDTVEFIK